MRCSTVQAAVLCGSVACCQRVSTRSWRPLVPDDAVEVQLEHVEPVVLSEPNDPVHTAPVSAVPARYAPVSVWFTGALRKPLIACVRVVVATKPSGRSHGPVELNQRVLADVDVDISAS